MEDFKMITTSFTRWKWPNYQDMAGQYLMPHNYHLVLHFWYLSGLSESLDNKVSRDNGSVALRLVEAVVNPLTITHTNLGVTTLSSITMLTRFLGSMMWAFAETMEWRTIELSAIPVVMKDAAAMVTDTAAIVSKLLAPALTMPIMPAQMETEVPWTAKQEQKCRKQQEKHRRNAAVNSFYWQQLLLGHSQQLAVKQHTQKDRASINLYTKDAMVINLIQPSTSQSPWKDPSRSLVTTAWKRMRFFSLKKIAFCEVILWKQWQQKWKGMILKRKHLW